jgi:formate hydrogenlyase subunit 3/multisubunit Na+/H+ antiporter MnhD subunit
VIGQIGLLMIVTAGIWAAFQKEFSRLFGYAIIVEAGFSLLAVSLNSAQGQQLFSSMFLPRMLAAGLWSLTLSILRKELSSTRFEDMQGILVKMPFASTGLAVASLTLAGFPLLAMFPIRLALMEALAQISLIEAVLALAGMVGMLFSTARALSVLVRGKPDERLKSESPMQILLIATGMAGLVIFGLFPQAILPFMSGLLSSYPPLP